MTDTAGIPDYPPTEFDDQWFLALCTRIVTERGRMLDAPEGGVGRPL